MALKGGLVSMDAFREVAIIEAKRTNAASVLDR
jgi:hypothetical protein